MVLLEFSMYPTDKGESVSKEVARSLEIIDESGLPYRLGPMGTCIEGEWDEVMAVVTRCFEKMSSDCGRIAVNLKVDYREGGEGRLESKVATVKRKTGRDLKTSTWRPWTFQAVAGSRSPPRQPGPRPARPLWPLAKSGSTAPAVMPSAPALARRWGSTMTGWWRRRSFI